MSVASATELSKQYQADLKKVAVDAYNNAPPGASEAEKIKLAQAAVTKFNQTEVEVLMVLITLMHWSY